MLDPATGPRLVLDRLWHEVKGWKTIGGIWLQCRPGHLSPAGTFLVGQMNPLRVDETSGRRLHGDGSPLFFGFPQAGDLTTFDYSGMDFICETAANHKAIYLNFPFWLSRDFSSHGVPLAQRDRVLDAMRELWHPRFPQTPLYESHAIRPNA